MEEDKRITDVNEWEAEQNAALDSTYGVQDENGNWSGGLIGQADSKYKDMADKLDAGTTALKDAANAATEQTISELQQKQADERKDYIKEQSGAYVDFQKQSNSYGVNAEKMASSGLTNSGYSESSQVAIYNQYQSRVATARETFRRVSADFDNAIAQARIQNSSALAQIGLEALQQKLTLMLEGFQYKNSLILQKTSEKRQVKSQAHSMLMDVLDQIYKENASAGIEKETEETDEIEKNTEGVTNVNTTGGILAPNIEGRAVMAGAIPKDTWDKLKALYNEQGIGNAAVANYNTYEEYARDYLKYKSS